MFLNPGVLFEEKENEIIFDEICQKLKNHPFHSPWAIFFDTKNEESDCEVQEIDVSKNYLETKDIDIHNENELVTNNDNFTEKPLQNTVDFDEEKFLSLKANFSSIQDTNTVEELASIELLSTLSLSQVPQFCKFIEDSISNETLLAVFLNSISNLKKPLSVTITFALLSQIIFPKILSLKCSNYRNLSSSIMKFLTVYPKVVIDAILIPCLNIHPLETSLQEMLLKIVKNILSDEHIAYCIQSIAKEVSVTENTFLVLQTLVEKKITYECNLHNVLANRMESWAPLYSSNMKFTKVLTCLLSIYGSEFSEHQLNIYNNLVKMNKTIMKRAAENLLKRLKIN